MESTKTKMKNFEELIEFIDSHPNDWIKLLKGNPYKLKIIREHPLIKNRYMLMYNLFGSTLSEPIVCQARGTVVDIVDGKCEIFCGPYIKFFNYGDPLCPNLDLSKSKVREKIDGWMIKTVIYRDNENKVNSQWFTNGAFITGVEEGFGLVKESKNMKIDESKEELEGNTFKTIKEVVIYALKRHSNVEIKDEKLVNLYCPWMDKVPDRTTLMFELTSAWNTVISNYDRLPKLTLHGCRLKSGDEINPEEAKDKFDLPFDVPKSFDLHDYENIKKELDKWKGTEQEGVVICDDKFNRIKFKCEDYLKIKFKLDHIPKYHNIFAAIIDDSCDDLAEYYNQIRDDIEYLKKMIEQVKIKSNEKILEVIKKNEELKKDYHLWVNNQEKEYRKFLWPIPKYKDKPEEYFESEILKRRSNNNLNDTIYKNHYEYFKTFANFLGITIKEKEMKPPTDMF